MKSCHWKPQPQSKERHYLYSIILCNLIGIACSNSTSIDLIMLTLIYAPIRPVRLTIHPSVRSVLVPAWYCPLLISQVKYLVKEDWTLKIFEQGSSFINIWLFHGMSHICQDARIWRREYTVMVIIELNIYSLPNHTPNPWHIYNDCSLRSTIRKEKSSRIGEGGPL